METKRTTTKERMQEVLAVLGVTSAEFEKKCGLSYGFTARITNVITKKTRARIKAAYPQLNLFYITHGQGEIFEKEQEAHDTIKKRILQFMERMDIGRKEFSDRTGIADSFISNMSDNVRNTSLEKIYRAFPRLNPTWLEYGEGEMLTDAPRRKTTDTIKDRTDRLIEFLGTTRTAFNAETKINTKAKNISKSTVDKIVRRYPFVNPLWLMHGTGKMIDTPQKPNSKKILYAPLVSQRAFAGYLTGLTDDEYLDSLDKIPYVEDNETRGNMVAIEVSGDSMDDGTSDSYRDGDVVLAKEVMMSDPLPIRKYDFVVVHKSGILIKRITKLTRKSVTIHSLNPEYGDVELNTADVLKLFIVTMRMSKPLH